MAPVSSVSVRAAMLALPVAALGFLAGAFTATPVSAIPAAETVTLAEGSAVALATPPFIAVGKRYAFTWPGGGPPQTYTIKSIRKDGWVEVQVAEENVDPAFLVPGQTPTRWLHAGIAVSVQEMRPLPY
jgi:hypothetical protein